MPPKFQFNPAALLQACLQECLRLRAVPPIVLLIATCLPLPAAVLPNRPTPQVVGVWTMQDGLPQDSVNAVLQTRDDYLWVGTDGGLARFDGVRFVTHRVTNAPGLANHSVKALFEDRSGTLWIGTENGAFLHRNGIFEPAGLAGRSVTAIVAQSDGTLWFATEAGLYRHSEYRLEAIDDRRLPPRPVQALHVDALDRVWIAQAGSPALFRIEGNALVELPPIPGEGAEPLAIAEAVDGTVWIGTTDGLVRAEAGGYRRYGVADGLAGRRISEILAAPDGSIWIAGAAVQHFVNGDLSTLETVATRGARLLQSLSRDREGNLWIGTGDEGLLRVRRSIFQRIGLNARNTTSGFRTVMQGADGTIWLSQGALGYSKVTRDAEIDRVPADSDAVGDEVLSVYSLRNGDLWVGSRDALRIIREGETASFPELKGIRTVFEDSEGRVWFGRQNQGIAYWKDGVVRDIDLPPQAALCTPASFAETSSGEIWAGTWLHGLIRLHGDEIGVLNTDAGMPTNELRFVYADRDDNLWVGTKSRGLALRHEGHWLFPEWTSDAIDQQVYSITTDDADNLWMGSPRGIFTVARVDMLQALRKQMPLNRLRLINVTEGLREGIPDLACFPNIWRANDGYIWFVTRTGVIRADAESARVNPMPTVHIERVTVNGERQSFANGLVLPPNTHTLAIEYTGLSLTAPQWVRFQYRLEGFDQSWVDADDRRVAQYSNLPSGRYRFQVIACNADGVWNDTGASLDIVQKARFYTEPWAQGLFAASLAGLTLGVFRWRHLAHERERRRLEVGIAERTRELRIAKEQAEASTLAKTEFLESISHEIRNPLNGIMGLVTLLREAPLDPRERELAQSLGACAKGLSRVFEEVLNFSRLEHGCVTVRERPFALGALVEGVVALFHSQTRERNVSVVVRREGDIPERWIGDADKIESIVSNFLSNALKYAPGSPIEILLQADGVTEDGADITINVTDRGPGIPHDEQENVFQKFVRGSNARLRRAPGTGLGLATCRALADLLGGHVAVESEPGEGSTFFLRLRLKRDRRPPPAAGPADAVARASNGRALVVEDQPYNRLVLQRIVERLGFVCASVPDAAAALASVCRQPCDLIIADWHLPDTNGGEFARRLRALPGGADPILLATTANDSDDIRREALLSGVDGFALKPLDLETVSRLLADARSRRQLSAPGQPLDTRVFRFVGDDDPSQAEAAARLYLDILDEEVLLLERALDGSDATAAAAAAHRIKSHAGLVEAADLREAADRLQRDARTATAGVLASLHDDVVRHAAGLRTHLKAWKSGNANG